MVVYVSLLLFFVIVSTSSFELLNDDSFDWYLANQTVSLSAAAYCDPESYLERDFSMVSPFVQNFQPTYRIISTESHDVNGFIGIMENSIYVVFRGSQSLSNFVDDFTIQLREEYCEGCFVHKGFFEATQDVLPGIVTEISRLRLKSPSLMDVVVTGHSLGAAIATIAALELTKKGFEVKLINYGSPRLANSKLAEFISNNIPIRMRVTNHRDLVPHLPLFALGYDHIQGEYYEDENAFVHECVGTSDPTCSSQWTRVEWSRVDLPSLNDHLEYLNQHMGSDICRTDIKE